MQRMRIVTAALAIALASLAPLRPAAAQPAPAGEAPAASPRPAASPPATAAPSAPAPAIMRRPTRDEVRAARAACRQEANAQDLKSTERAKFLLTCFAAKMPAVVKRTACRKEAKAKGLSQAGLRAHIRQCMRGR
jgi:hypothetical protein